MYRILGESDSYKYVSSMPDCCACTCEDPMGKSDDKYCDCHFDCDGSDSSDSLDSSSNGKEKDGSSESNG
jgi:hypothetical protein